MTTKAQFSPAASAALAPHGLSIWLAGRIDTVLNWLERREQLRALEAMDEWQLKDIGVTRGDVLRETGRRHARHH